jgi:hypothetical protein
LPADDTDLDDAFTGSQVTAVQTSDDSRVAQTGYELFVLFEFKDDVGELTSTTFHWEGRCSVSPVDSTVYLQIYNRTLAVWQTIDFDDEADANTDFVLEGSKADLTDYKDANDFVACRVYQAL